MKIVMNEELRKLIEEGESKRYHEIARNKKLYDGLIRAYSIMESIETVKQLGNYSFLHYERLRYQYSGLSSVRLSNRFVHRLIFSEENDKITLKLIEIDNTHYGNKK